MTRGGPVTGVPVAPGSVPLPSSWNIRGLYIFFVGWPCNVSKTRVAQEVMPLFLMDGSACAFGPRKCPVQKQATF